MKSGLKSDNERGPVEVVASRGVRIPIYLNPRRGKDSYLVTCFAKGARKRERVSNLTDARKRAKTLVPELLDGKVRVASFSLKQTTAIMDAVEIIRPYNVSITEAARQFAEARRILGDDSLLQAPSFSRNIRHRNKVVALSNPLPFPTW